MMVDTQQAVSCAASVLPRHSMLCVRNASGLLSLQTK